MVALGVFSPPDPTKTPRIHGAIIPLGYVSVSTDRVNKGFGDLALDIPGGDGEKTLGEAEKTFIYYGTSATSLFLGSLVHRRFLNCQTIGEDKSERNNFFTNFLLTCMINNNNFLYLIILFFNSHSRASANLSPIIQSSDHHSASGNDNAMPPPPPPPRRSPTPPTLVEKWAIVPVLNPI